MNPHFQRAQLLYSQSRYADAERELGFSLSQHPEDAWSLALLGACRAKQEKFAEAVELGMQAIALQPDDANIRYLVASIELDRNDLSAAERTINSAILINPQDEDYYALRAAIHAQRRNWQECLTDCERALEIDPDCIQAANLKVAALRATGEMESATSDIQEVLRRDPDNAWSHANMGWTVLQQGDYKQAEVHFREALRLEPELEYARNGVKEAIKARVPPYRWFLKYIIWMSQRSTLVQWGVILGFWFGYQLVKQVANANPSLASWLLGPIIAYLLFVVCTWFAKQVSDAMLLFHPFGRLALTRQEKREGLFVVAYVLIEVVLIALAYNQPQDETFVAAVAFGTVGLPIAMSFHLDHRKAKRIMYGLAGCAFVLSSILVLYIFEPIPALMPGKQIVGTSLQLLLFAPLATIILLNVLASREWRED